MHISWNVCNLFPKYLDAMANSVPCLFIGACNLSDYRVFCKFFLTETKEEVSDETLKNDKHIIIKSFFIDSRNTTIFALKKSSRRGRKITPMAKRLGAKYSYNTRIS